MWSFFITILVGQPHTVFGGIPLLTSAAALGTRRGPSGHTTTATAVHTIKLEHMATSPTEGYTSQHAINTNSAGHQKWIVRHTTTAAAVHSIKLEHMNINLMEGYTSQHAINTSWEEQSDARVTVQINEHICSVWHLPTCLSQHNDHLAHSLL